MSDPKPVSASARVRSAARVLTVASVWVGATFVGGCGAHDDHGADHSTSVRESAGDALDEYSVRRESAVTNGQRTVVLSRSPELGELSVEVSEQVTAAEARELASFLLARHGAPYASRIRSISRAGPSRWAVVVESEPPVHVAGQQVQLRALSDPRDDHVTIARNEGALEITASEQLARP